MRESSVGPVEVHPAVADAEAVLFDFDFTLADSSAGIITCINYALAEMGLGEASTDDIIKTVGLYIPDALVVLKGEQHRHLGDEFMRLFTHKADDVMVDGTFFLPGAEYMLRTLSELGYRLAIVSTKYRFRIETVLERDGLRDTVEVIIGGEDVTDHKPHPEGLLKAAGRLGLPVKAACTLGTTRSMPAPRSRRGCLSVLCAPAQHRSILSTPIPMRRPTAWLISFGSSPDSDRMGTPPAGPL